MNHQKLIDLIRTKLIEGVDGPNQVFSKLNEKMTRIEEMMNSKNPEMKELGRVLQKEKKTAEYLGLPLIQKIQKVYPEVVVSGSAALFLHNIRLQRMCSSSASNSDIDIILPYFVPFTDFEDVSFDTPVKKGTSGKEYDFDYQLNCTYSNEGYRSRKLLDVKIDPKRHYEVVEYEEVKYKVSLLEDIMLAKLTYLQSGVVKHRDDLYEMLGKAKVVQKVETRSYGGS